MSEPASGIRPDDALVAAGWVRRHLVSPEGAAEAVETYRSLGFEARAEVLTPESFGPSCRVCGVVICRTYRLVYTRRLPQEEVS